MNYAKFILYNIVGGAAWASLFLYAGFFFGDIQFIKENFSIVAIAIIIISVLPIVIELIRNKMAKKS